MGTNKYFFLYSVVTQSYSSPLSILLLLLLLLQKTKIHSECYTAYSCGRKSDITGHGNPRELVS